MRLKKWKAEFARRRETDPDAKSYDVTKEMVADETANPAARWAIIWKKTTMFRACAFLIWVAAS